MSQKAAKALRESKEKENNKVPLQCTCGVNGGDNGDDGGDNDGDDNSGGGEDVEKYIQPTSGLKMYQYNDMIP